MFEFFKIRFWLNWHDRKTRKAIEKASRAANDLSKVNNSLLTIQANADNKIKIYDNISFSTQNKMNTNKGVIDALSQIQNKQGGK